MMAAAFDTLTAARRMEEAGMKREQAEAVAETVRSAAESGREELATKSDVAVIGSELGALRSEVKSDLDSLRSEVKSDLDALRSEVKSDLDALRSEVKSDLDAHRTEFKSDLDTGLAGLRVELVDRIQSTERRMYAAVFGVGGLLFAALKLVP